MIEYLTTHRAKLVERAVAASLCRGAQCVASGNSGTATQRRGYNSECCRVTSACVDIRQR